MAGLLEDQDRQEDCDEKFVGGISKSEKNGTNECCVWTVFLYD